MRIRTFFLVYLKILNHVQFRNAISPQQRSTGKNEQDSFQPAANENEQDALMENSDQDLQEEEMDDQEEELDNLSDENREAPDADMA